MAGFQRTTSFPAMGAAAKRSSYKIRSLSLRVRFDPIVSHMNDNVATLISWTDSSIQSPYPAWLHEGVRHISSVLDSLMHVLNHQLIAQQRRDSPYANIPMSNDLRRLKDLYESFCNSLRDLAPLHANTWAALVRQDRPRVALSIQAQREVADDIQKLASAVQKAAKTQPNVKGASTLPIAICNAIMALASASSIVFIGIYALSEESAALAMPMAARPEKPMKCIDIKQIVCTINWNMRVKKKEVIREAEREEEQERAKIAAIDHLCELNDCIKVMQINCKKVYNDLALVRANLLGELSFR